jgi:hypothetical protein
MVFIIPLGLLVKMPQIRPFIQVLNKSEKTPNVCMTSSSVISPTFKKKIL